ncbi:MAG: trypsin-like serine protease [Methylophilaceae bacterium]|nr:trypsin-like serine protease [Methylophilaceae bacterium]
MYSTNKNSKAVQNEIRSEKRSIGIIARWRTPQKLLVLALTLLPAISVVAATASAYDISRCRLSNAELYESKSPAVVRITALTINPYRQEDRVHQAAGSGFIIDDRGLVMTNSHVVFGAQAVSVTLNDGTTLPARLLGTDPIFDLAILQLPKPDKGKFSVLDFGDSDQVRQGDEILVIGNPMGLGQTITSGIVSAHNRILPERPRLLSWPMIQTDAAINSGNSGGPLLNSCGDVIGVVSVMLGNAQNIGFAVPSNLAKTVVTSLVEKGRLIRPWLGVDGSLIDASMKQIFAVPLTSGFMVESVEPGSPASIADISGGRLPVKVGLRSLILGGDIIVAINDIELKDNESLQKAFDLVHIGSKIKLKVFRQDKIFTAELNIIERPLQPGDMPESSQSFSVFQGLGSSENKAHRNHGEIGVSP